jgi:hypothetical protein
MRGHCHMHAKHCAKAQSLEVHHYVRDDKFLLFFTEDANAFLAGKYSKRQFFPVLITMSQEDHQSTQLFYLGRRISHFCFLFFFFLCQ